MSASVTALRRDESPLDAFRRQFENARLPGAGRGWLDALRRQAMARVAAGFPTRRDEAWRYTDLSPLLAAAWAPTVEAESSAIGDALADVAIGGLACDRLVFVDGHARPDLSSIGALPAGARVITLAQALDGDGPLADAVAEALTADPLDHAPAALNLALASDGAVVVLDDDVALPRPLHVISLGARGETAAHLRHLVIGGARSAATLIETRTGSGWSNTVTDIALAAEARLDRVAIHCEDAAGFDLGLTRARLADGACIHDLALAFGARIARNEVLVRLSGEGAACRLDGAFLLRGHNHADTTTVIEHLAPDTRSHEHVHGVIDDAGHGVFQGRVVVHPVAQQTDAHQLNKNLLLADEARVDTKPELEIRADDVKCSHGATAGALDDEALFYLESRGLNPHTARRLLIEGFVADVLDNACSGPVHAHLRGLANAWLGAK